MGDPSGFTISITNNSEEVAGNVTLTDTLPTAAELCWSVGGTDAASCAITAGVLSCNFGDMPPGALKTIKLTSPTPTDHAFCPTISNTATVMADNQPEGRSVTASTEVLCSVCVTVQPGEAATLTLPNGQGQIEFPADLVTVPTTFIYTKQNAPSQSLGSYTFAGITFTLVATDPNGNPVTSFPANYTIRLTYQDSD